MTDVPAPSGGIDDALLARAVAATPNGGTLTFPVGKTYRCDDSFTIDTRHDLTIEANGSTLRWVTQGTQGRRHARFRYCDGCTFRNLKVTGANPHGGVYDDAWKPQIGAFQHGFSILGGSGNAIEDCEAYDVYGDLLYVGEGQDEPAVGVTVRNFTGARNGRMGIALASVADFECDTYDLREIRWSAIDLEPMRGEGWAVSDATFRNGIIGNRRHSVVASDTFNYVGEVLFDGLAVVAGKTPQFVYRPNADAAPRRGRLTIRNYRSAVKASAPVLMARRVDGLEVSGADFTFSRAIAATTLADVDHVRYGSNTFRGASKQAQVDSACSDVQIT